MTIKSIGVLSAGKVMGILYALLGLIFGGLFTLLSLAGFAASGGDQQAGAGALIFGAGAIIILPIFYGVMGFIGGLLMALLYNVVASLAGGLEIEFDRTGAARIE